MSGWSRYMPETETEKCELAEYKKRWGNRGLEGLSCYVMDHGDRARWIRLALERDKAIYPSDFGQKRWWDPEIIY